MQYSNSRKIYDRFPCFREFPDIFFLLHIRVSIDKSFYQAVVLLKSTIVVLSSFQEKSRYIFLLKKNEQLSGVGRKRVG